MTTDVERAIAELVAIGILEQDFPKSSIEDLAIFHARSLGGLEECTGLATLSLTGCAVGEYDVVSRLPALRVLVIENADLTDVAWATGLPLQTAFVRRSRLRDAMPLLDLTDLQSIDLTGNPLDEQSRAAATADDTDRLCYIDDAETARVNVRLADKATGIVAYRRDGALRACATGLDITDWPEAGHVETTVEQLELVVSGALTPRQLLGLDPGEGEGGPQ
jgi:hypothetical protein